MNIAIILLIGVIVSDIIYILYKKYNGESPKKMMLFFSICPFLGAVASTAMYWQQDLGVLLKGLLFITIILMLIPINVVCIKNGFIRTGNSAKNTFDEAKKIIKEQKEENDEFKKSWKTRKNKDNK